MSDRNTFHPATQSGSLREVVGKAKVRRKKDKKNPLKWWGKVSESLEDKLGGVGSFGAHAGTGAAGGLGIAALTGPAFPLVAVPAAIGGSIVGTVAYVLGKYKQPKDKEEEKSCYI